MLLELGAWPAVYGLTRLDGFLIRHGDGEPGVTGLGKCLQYVIDPLMLSSTMRQSPGSEKMWKTLVAKERQRMPCPKRPFERALGRIDELQR
jgi:hypothetical protein